MLSNSTHDGLNFSRGNNGQKVSSNPWFLVMAMIGYCFVNFATDAHAESKPAQTLVRVGQDLFGQYCAACHGSDAKGSGPVASALQMSPSDLTTIAKRRGGEFPAAHIAEVIDGRAEVTSHGSREMPVWGRRLSEKFGDDFLGESAGQGEIAALVEYLRSIQH